MIDTIYAFHACTCISQVFLEPFTKLVGSTRAASLLLSSCSTQSQRNRLHQLGFAFSISQWIEDFQERVSHDKGDSEGVLFNEHYNDESKRLITAVRPVASSISLVSQQAEVCTVPLCFMFRYLYKVIKIVALNAF